LVLSAVNSMLRKRKGEGLTKSIEAYQRDSAYMKGRGEPFPSKRRTQDNYGLNFYTPENHLGKLWSKSNVKKRVAA